MSDPRTVIVTGAAAGIGRATVARLVAEGWRVVGLDRTDAALEGSDLVVGDAGDAGLLEAALARCGGSLDALVCAAGIPRRVPGTAVSTGTT